MGFVRTRVNFASISPTPPPHTLTHPSNQRINAAISFTYLPSGTYLYKHYYNVMYIVYNNICISFVYRVCIMLYNIIRYDAVACTTHECMSYIKLLCSCIHRRRHIANVPRSAQEMMIDINIYLQQALNRKPSEIPKTAMYKVNVVNHRTGNCINSRCT